MYASQYALIRVCCVIVAEELCNCQQLGVLLCVRESERVSEERESFGIRVHCCGGRGSFTV